MSERTLLPVVLPIKALPNIPQKLAKGLSQVPTELGVGKQLIEQERFAMARSSFHTTPNRALSLMKDFPFPTVGSALGQHHQKSTG